jgi:hypothetical protein
MQRFIFISTLIAWYAGNSTFAQTTSGTSADSTNYARKLRENALLKVEPKVIFSPVRNVYTGNGPRYTTGPSLIGRGALSPGAGLRYETGPSPIGRGVPSSALSTGPGRYPWKLNIVTTIFWTGEHPTSNNPVPNSRSSWDRHWAANFGGYDNPNVAARRDFIPIGFIPRQNPFYVALPYNDVEGGRTKAEAPSIIPWFRAAFVRSGQTVLKDRWVAIRHGGRVCYAQWEDCGPFRTDHWQYVFGNERPRPNLNQGAGLDVSPAVRDYLGLANKDVCDWKFVEYREVPSGGPWARYGENNTFVLLRQKNVDRFARRGEFH